ncbi:MAG: hypothetical protein U0232_07355 [Thermomicrobiales bacterium]
MPFEPRRILAVKLFALGDLLNTTPALRALRERFPDARLDVLTTRQGKPGLANSPHINDVLVFDKSLFDDVGGLTSPRALWAGVRFALDLRLRRYDTLVLLHHLITPWGTIKYTVLALWSGARIRAGLDNGRGWFLTHRAPDWGFGVHDERQYWLDIAAAIGATSDNDRPVFVVPQADRGRARRSPTKRARATRPTRRHPRDERHLCARAAVACGALCRRRRPAGGERDAAIVLVGVQSGPGIARVAAAMRHPRSISPGRRPYRRWPGSSGRRPRRRQRQLGRAPCGGAWHPHHRPLRPLQRPRLATLGRGVGGPPGRWRLMPPLPANHALAVRSADPHAPCIYTGYGRATRWLQALPLPRPARRRPRRHHRLPIARSERRE